MIKQDRLGVMSYWSDIERAGRRVSKIRPVAARPPSYEYWAYPPRPHAEAGTGAEVRSQARRDPRENRALKAVRLTKGGPQFQEFTDLRQAEDWIAESDRLSRP